MLIFLMSVVGLLIMALASIFEMTKQKAFLFLIIDMVQYTLSNITQWHILVAHWMKISLENQWS